MSRAGNHHGDRRWRRHDRRQYFCRGFANDHRHFVHVDCGQRLNSGRVVMAIGDTVTNWVPLDNNATLDVGPGTGIEWLIHTLLSESGKSMEVYWVGGGSPGTYTLVDTHPGGSVHALTFRLNETYRMRLKNVSGGTAYVGFQGVVTK